MRINRFFSAKKALAGVLVGALLVTSTATGNGFFKSTVSVMAASEWSATEVYTGGSQVTYNGATYEAQWWTQGEEPGTSSVWKLISGSSDSGSTGGSTSGTLTPKSPSVSLDPKVGTNIQGVKLPSTYYNKKVVGYFPNYAIDSDAHEHFNITDLQWDKLTHVQYAFACVNKETFEIEAGDVKNDIENKFEGQTFVHDGQVIEMDPTLGYYGQFNLMHTLKKMHPNVTVLISTGGWGSSEGLWYATQNESTMRTFSKSAVEFIRKYGFDGIDIDFEFPSETPLSGNYTDFTESIRAGISDRYVQFIKILSEDLSAAAKEDGKYYWLTSAVSASSWVLGGQTNSDFLDYLDFVSIMSYDYHGGWNNYVENQANLYPDDADGETATQAVKTLGFDWSYKFYRGKVQSEKILMGVPYYTRGWTNVSGGTNGLHGTSGTPITNATDNLNLWCDIENGQEVAAGANPLWHVMNVMKSNSDYKYYWDEVGKVPHIWNATNNTFLTFEDTNSIQERINYVNDNNLGGVLIWVMHGDYDYDAATDTYTIGDTLTTMLYDQFAAKGPSTVTSDIDYTNDAINFDVDMSGGKYDHPNYTYSIKVTNNTGVQIPSGYTFSFDIPKSTQFTSAWGGTASVVEKDQAFNTVTITSSSALDAGATVEFTGMMKCCFSAAKNFKINGYSQLSEVTNEIQRLNRSYLTSENGSEETETPETPTTTTTTTTEAAEASVDGFSTIEAENYSSNEGGVKDTNSSASNGYNMGGITNNVSFTYNNVEFSEDAAAITLQYSSKSGDALGNAEIYVDSSKVGTVTLENTGSTWSNYVSITSALDTMISKGTHTVTLKFVTTGSAYYVCNLDYFTFVRNSQYTPEVVTNAKVDINGYQISTTAEGYRVVYTVTDADSEVKSAGLVYGLASGCSSSDMVVGSSNSVVASYQATENGKVNIPSIAAENAQNYAMTMLFDKSASFFSQKIYVRAYAELNAGGYVYSDVKEFSIYQIADYMYQNNAFKTFASHNYLYNTILKVVNPSYEEVDFKWSNYFVK